MNFTKLDELKNQLKNMRPLNDTEIKRLYDEFIINNTYESNAIEGNTLTLRETALILQEGITIAGKNIKEHLEVIGHKEAFEYVLYLSSKNTILTEQTIKEIHSLVLMNDTINKGVYRRIPVTIVGSTNKPSEPHLISQQMQRLLEEYKNMKTKKHIVEVISEFHLRFECIHPFIDGNGRTGRLILNLELMKSGLLPINIKFKDRHKYYDCFDNYCNNNTSDMLVQLITNYELKELEEYINKLKGL